jgi:aspartyl protease family protein
VTALKMLDQLIPPISGYIAAHAILQLALWSLAPLVLGTIVRGILPFLGGTLRLAGQLGLFVALALTAAQLVHFPLNLAPLGDDQSGQTMTGTETRVHIADDGHFWVTARAHGTVRRLLVDTGATLTTLSLKAANDLGAIPDPDGSQITLTTANGMTKAELGLIPSLRVGNVVVHQLPVAVAPGLADTNVLGMNFLSQLASWRVEGNTLILVPHHPQETKAET